MWFHERQIHYRSHIFTLIEVMEKFYEHDKDLHSIFIDFQQAYDSIIRNRLWSALVHFGIPKNW